MKHIMIDYIIFWRKKTQLHYMNSDIFVLKINSSNNFRDTQNLENLFNLSNLNKNLKYIVLKTKKLLVK